MLRWAWWQSQWTSRCVHTCTTTMTVLLPPAKIMSQTEYLSTSSQLCMWCARVVWPEVLIVHGLSLWARKEYASDVLMSHTLAQKYLIELLLWSASGVHKQSPKVWQENWMTWRENHCIRILSLSLQKATVPSDEVSSKSDCENRTVDWNLLTPKFWRRFRCSIIHNGNWKNQTTCRYLA